MIEITQAFETLANSDLVVKSPEWDTRMHYSCHLIGSICSLLSVAQKLKEQFVEIELFGERKVCTLTELESLKEGLACMYREWMDIEK